jgi:ABC-2 type transport system ATP-binding protein
MAMNAGLVLDGVTKRYAGHTAIEDLSLLVPTGSVFGILGPNGAGKSTTLRIIMNVIGRDDGTVSILGTDPREDPRILRRVGYLPEERGLYARMKVLDVIVFFAGLKGMRRAHARRQAEAWLEKMGLGEWRDARVDTLSRGMQQKVQFITTVVHEPDILILDEPHSGLDPVNQEVLRDTILEAAAAGRTVILSTHNMEHAERLCERVCIIARAHKVLDGPVREIRRDHRTNRYVVEFDDASPEVTRFLTRSGRFSHIAPRHRGWELELGPDTKPADLLRELADLDAPLRRFERAEPSLHEIFVMHVGEASRAPRSTGEAA